MNKIVFLLLLAVMISACSTTPKNPISVQIQKVVVMPSEAQFRCPDMPFTPPNIDTLMDVEVADYLLQLYETGSICKDSLEGIRQFLLDSQLAIDKAEAEKEK